MILLLLLAVACGFAADFEPATLIRLHPLGGRAGSVVELEILGTKLETASGVAFDCKEIVWEQTTLREAGRVRGLVSIGADAALGGHMLQVLTAQGPTGSLLFNVGQFPSFVEGEQRAVPSLPVEIYGRLDGAADIDTYWFSVRAGERWTFDLQAMEAGSAVEARLILLDHGGEKLVFNDDRDHYDENPLIAHTFTKGGVYGVRIDQYRGPRGFTFGKNNAYFLRISQLARVQAVAPLGARRGTTSKIMVLGEGLTGATKVWLTELRRGEYARMTYPYTMPVRFRDDVASRIEGKILRAGEGQLDVSFAVPASASTGLWKLWVAGPGGVAEGLRVEIGEEPEVGEGPLPAALPFVVNGVLGSPRERDSFALAVKKGVPLAVTSLSAQLGGPYLDTVLTLRDRSGKKLAESDDVVAGWGGLLGNPDSALFYVPAEDGLLRLEVRDRLNRGGPLYPYRLHFASRRPGFQLFTTPENVTVKRGGTAVMKVHLVREMGFTGPVDVWVDGMPGLRGTFRADQLFEPNADGADMLIPEMELRISGSEKTGVLPLRVFGRGKDGLVVEGHTAAMIGPIYQGDWNFYRRPVAGISLHVVE